MSTSANLLNGLASAAVLVALLFLFVAGLRLPVARAGWRRWCSQGLVILGAVALTLLANVALYRHDVYFDVTHERAFTPSPEAQRVVQGLTTDVDLLYFYQKQHPAGLLAKRLVEIMTRVNPRLHVRTVDLDQYPGLANTYGVRVYNVAVLESSGRRLHVVSTDDRDIALGLLRVTRATVKTICFVVGHGEYDIDNMEYHTHFEGVHTHSHGAEGIGVVLMEQHGLGRLRRALESLGLSTQQVTLATTGHIPEVCAVLVEANPHTMYTPSESTVLADYCARGGAVLLLVDLAFPVEPGLAALLAQAERKAAAHKTFTPQELAERFPLFAGLTLEQREVLLLHFKPRTAEPGERIFRAGDEADGVYFISKGEVEVAVAGRQLKLGAGEVFGEMALISGQPRSADVTALDYSTFAMLSGRDFRQLLRKYPEIRAQIVRLAAQREESDRQVLVDDLPPEASRPS
jgi:hypothetical protein